MSHTHRNRRARLEVELLEDRNAPVSLWAFDMPTSLLPVKPVPLAAEPVRGFDAAANFVRSSLRQLIPSMPSQGRVIASKESAAPDGGLRETFAPLSAEPAVAPTLPMSHVAPPSLGITSAAVGFGTLTATAAFESRSLGWSVGFVGENNTARWLDPFVSRQVDVGPLRNPRSFSESSSDFVEQFVDWNADNDNGSEVTDYIPAVRDYQVGFTPDENDVVPLTLVEVPNGGYYPEAPVWEQWRLQVTYTGTGRLRFWDSPEKRNELFPRDDWQFTPHDYPRLIGDGRPPGIHIEGMEMSSAVGDIRVSFALRTQDAQGNLRVREFKQVKVAVTPVLKEFKELLLDDATFITWPEGEVAPNSRGGGIRGGAELYARYVPPLFGEMAFFQNLTCVTQNLSGWFIDCGLTNILDHAFEYAPKPSEQQPLQTWQGRPANFTIPFLDCPEYIPNDPRYPRKSNLQSNQFPGEYVMVMADYPKRPIAPSINRIDYTLHFATFVGWWIPMPEQRGGPIVAAIGRLNWQLRYSFGAWDDVLLAMTASYSKTTTNGTWQRVAANGVPILRPNIANNNFYDKRVL